MTVGNALRRNPSSLGIGEPTRAKSRLPVLSAGGALLCAQPSWFISPSTLVTSRSHVPSVERAFCTSPVLSSILESTRGRGPSPARNVESVLCAEPGWLNIRGATRERSHIHALNVARDSRRGNCSTSIRRSTLIRAKTPA